MDKHIGFADDTEDHISEGKLRRRDTPHHLKNKRINMTTAKDDAEEKVRAILSQANPGAKLQPSLDRPKVRIWFGVKPVSMEATS